MNQPNLFAGQTQFEVKYETKGKKGFKIFTSFESAYRFVFDNNPFKYVDCFNERWADGTFICYETNPFNAFSGRVFCVPIGVKFDSIQVHQKPVILI